MCGALRVHTSWYCTGSTIIKKHQLPYSIANYVSWKDWTLVQFLVHHRIIFHIFWMCILTCIRLQWLSCAHKLFCEASASQSTLHTNLYEAVSDINYIKQISQFTQKILTLSLIINTSSSLSSCIHCRNLRNILGSKPQATLSPRLLRTR